MREKEANRKTVGSGAAVLGGLMIAALAFSAGFVGARSHRPADSRASEAVVRTTTAEAAQGVEPLSIRSSDRAMTEHRLPGHSELDLQLD
jgi:hypothetical protein